MPRRLFFRYEGSDMSQTRNASQRPLVVVTNDDGVEATGLRELAAALRESMDVLVVAPDGERSAIGHAVTLSARWRVWRHAPDVWALQGTPADCVYFAFAQLVPRRPALVVSGVNNGFNLGTDVIYSGTVAAAAEAVVLDCPGMAVSAEAGATVPTLQRASKFAAALARWVVDTGWGPPQTLLNINVPEGAQERFDVGAMGVRRYRRPQRRSEPPTSGEEFELGRPRSFGHEGATGPDAEIVRSGSIAVTPLRLDWTARDELDVCRDIEVRGFESSAGSAIGFESTDGIADSNPGERGRVGGSGAHGR